jgi:signal transduction histidine kinase
VKGDTKRLRQIMKNLVSNGIKFTPQGQITITAAPTADGKFVQVNVQDTGMGIAKENLAMVFEQFRQVDSDSTREIGGTGLGLPITRELVQMHGGEIWVESEPGVGSTFSFTIPVVTVVLPG